MKPTSKDATTKQQTLKQEPNQWIWSPQEDITTWELAQAMTAFINAGAVGTFPPEVRRHFKKSEPPK
jgi:hypothetical protein